MKKITLLKKLRYRRKHWDLLIEKVKKNGFENKRLSNNWNLRDVVAHISWYDKECRLALETKSIANSEFWRMALDDRNKMIYEKNQEKSLDEVIAESKENFEALIAVVETLSDEEVKSEDFITYKSEKGKRPTWDFIGAQNFWHFEDHEDAIIECLDLDYCYND